ATGPDKCCIAAASVARTPGVVQVADMRCRRAGSDLEAAHLGQFHAALPDGIEHLLQLRLAPGPARAAFAIETTGQRAFEPAAAIADDKAACILLVDFLDRRAEGETAAQALRQC